jgi:hypothetical protein
MVETFSQELIRETIACFKEENGIDISPEEANQYLHAFANLFLAFASGNSNSRPHLSADEKENNHYD